MFPNKVYDTLRWIVQYLLPGFGTLYFGLSKIWTLPFPQEVVGTVACVTAFLGAILGISNLRYKAKYKFEKFFSKTTSFVLSMPSNVYDTVKWVSMIFLPSLGALYFGLSKLWGFPYGEQIVATIAAVEAFVGVLLGVSTSEFEERKNL